MLAPAGMAVKAVLRSKGQHEPLQTSSSPLIAGRQEALWVKPVGVAHRCERNCYVAQRLCRRGMPVQGALSSAFDNTES